MRWQDLHREIGEKLQGYPALADQRPIMRVDTARQKLYLLDIESRFNRHYPISTAARGTGNQVDSYQTPLGIHRVREKIGGDQPEGMIFEARKPVERLAASRNNQEKDEITSRILWLDGLEEGINQGGNCDTYSRYIYIHGTSDEQRIGQAVSAGCIRMMNQDVIELFDLVQVGDLIVIS